MRSLRLLSFAIFGILVSLQAQSAFALCAQGSACIRGTCPTAGCGAGLECRQITGGDAACVTSENNPLTVVPSCADINCGAAECRTLLGYPSCYGSQSGPTNPCDFTSCQAGTTCEVTGAQTAQCVPDEPIIVTPPVVDTCATTTCAPGLVCEQQTRYCFRAPCPQPAPRCVVDPNANPTCATPNVCPADAGCFDTSTGPVCDLTGPGPDPEPPVPPVQTCDTVTCAPGLVCEQEFLGCAQVCDPQIIAETGRCVTNCPQPSPQCVVDPNAKPTCATPNVCPSDAGCLDTSNGPRCISAPIVDPEPPVVTPSCATVRCGFGQVCRETAQGPTCGRRAFQRPPGFPEFSFPDHFGQNPIGNPGTNPGTNPGINPGFNFPEFPSFGNGSFFGKREGGRAGTRERREGASERRTRSSCNRRSSRVSADCK